MISHLSDSLAGPLSGLLGHCNAPPGLPSSSENTNASKTKQDFCRCQHPSL